MAAACREWECGVCEVSPHPHEAIAFSYKGSSHLVAVWMMSQVGETSLPSRALVHHVVLAPAQWVSCLWTSRARLMMSQTILSASCPLDMKPNGDPHSGAETSSSDPVVCSSQNFGRGCWFPQELGVGSKSWDWLRAEDARPLLGAIGSTPHLWLEGGASSQGTDK